MLYAQVFLILMICESADFYQYKIVNGTAVETTIPYQLQLISFNPPVFCGAVIISNYYALSAAHCLKNQKAQNIILLSGSSELYRGDRHAVKLFYVHPLYAQFAPDFDIAVIKVMRYLRFNQKVFPAALPSGPVPYGKIGVISGFGRMTLDGKLSIYLRMAYVVIFEQKTCERLYSEITPRMFCAGRPQVDSCHGDSGGPLIVNGQVYGIVSWGSGCEGFGVYANVPNLLEFIESKIRD